jgi:uncharacterized protein (DUF983 family)
VKMPTAINKNFNISPVPNWSGSESWEMIASGGIARPANCNIRARVCMESNVPGRCHSDKTSIDSYAVHEWLMDGPVFLCRWQNFAATTTMESDYSDQPPQQKLRMSATSTRPPATTLLGTLLGRGMRLRCPTCGRGKLFRNWFSMHDPCQICGRKFDRAPGYLLGSIYFNYGVTAFLVVVLYFSLYLAEAMTSQGRLLTVGAFSLFFPVWFFRYARALWIAFDELFDPWPNEEEQRELKKQLP